MQARKKIVVLGGGFAAFRFAKTISLDYYEVTLVSPRNFFLFTPLLASTTVGTVEFRSIIEPLREVQAGVRFLQAECTGIMPELHRISCKSEMSDGASFELEYDILVIAVGAVPQTFNIPGVWEHAHMLKELSDARKVRQRIIELFEKASLPSTSEKERDRLLHFVVVGGGPTGVEFAGEIHDMIKHDIRRAYASLANEARITLIEASSGLLTSFDRSLGEYTQRVFTRRNISVRTESLVKEVREAEVILRDDTIIPFGLLIWSTGVGPTDFVRSSQFEKNKAGRIIVDEYLRVQGVPDVYALGDCANVTGHDFPMTGQAAQQQGKYLAGAMNRTARGRKVKPFVYNNMGMLAYIGGQKALADTPGVKWRGVVAWLMWRSVYITKLVSMRNKVRVLFDWIKTSIFGRDVSSF